MDTGYYDEDIEDLAPSVDPERSVTVDRYATTMEEALGFVKDFNTKSITWYLKRKRKLHFRIGGIDS